MATDKNGAEIVAGDILNVQVRVKTVTQAGDRHINLLVEPVETIPLESIRQEFLLQSKQTTKE